MSSFTCRSFLQTIICTRGLVYYRPHSPPPALSGVSYRRAIGGCFTSVLKTPCSVPRAGVGVRRERQRNRSRREAMPHRLNGSPRLGTGARGDGSAVVVRHEPWRWCGFLQQYPTRQMYCAPSWVRGRDMCGQMCCGRALHITQHEVRLPLGNPVAPCLTRVLSKKVTAKKVRMRRGKREGDGDGHDDADDDEDVCGIDNFQSLSPSALVSNAVGGLPRFLVDSLPSEEGAVACLVGDELWHLRKVLRMKKGDELELFDGRGGLTKARLLHVGQDEAMVETVEATRVVPYLGPRWDMVVACGSLKGGRADWLVEKCTELGARSLVPLLTVRSAEVKGGRMDRWSRVAMAATKQCQRFHSLIIDTPISLSDLLPRVRESELALLAAAMSPPLTSVIARHSRSFEMGGGMVIIGPEGDFTPLEIAELRGAGAIPVGLGPRRLRVETAAIASLSALILMGESPVISSSP